MKKILLFVAFASLFACKNEPKIPAETPKTYEDIDGVISPKETKKTIEEVIQNMENKAQALAPTHEAITEESISLPDINDACMNAVLAIAKSSVRINETMNLIKKEGRKPAFIVLKDEEKEGVYTIKLGVNLELRFDTWTNFTYFATDENLTEEDMVSGENEPIDFDLRIAEKLPKSCF